MIVVVIRTFRTIGYSVLMAADFKLNFNPENSGTLRLLPLLPRWLSERKPISSQDYMLRLAGDERLSKLTIDYVKFRIYRCFARTSSLENTSYLRDQWWTM